ncbi:MAG: Hsp70 family protein [Deltaproteobacteria bacterium]|nr:Hsp70 family protein [Deltaproteobacteria bacterium]
MSKKANRIYGIDLGTTYSSVAYVGKNGKPELVPNTENEFTTPSVVLFDGDRILVGSKAKQAAGLRPDDVVSFIKRSMGEADFLFYYQDVIYRPEEISSFLLRKLAWDVEQVTGEKMTDVVITCPAYFGINEREATRLAGEIAGLNVRQIINEPTAAAIAYGSTEAEDDRVVLVYDLGGGTFDITMIHVGADAIRVICTGGDHNLGGKDWDDRIIAWLVEQYQEKTGTREDILENPTTWQHLQFAAEDAKKALSAEESVTLPVEHEGNSVEVTISREKFEQLTEDLLTRTMSLVADTMEQAKKKAVDKVDEIILVGGSTRMPQVGKRLLAEFGMRPMMFDPEKAVAKGAAIYAWKLAMNDSLVQRVAEKNQKTAEEVASRLNFDSEKVRAAMRKLAMDMGYESMDRSMVSIQDVSSKSFGVVVGNEDGGEDVYNVILRNTAVPVKASDTFYTQGEDQRRVDVRIAENESSEERVDLASAVEIGTAVLHLPPGLPARSPVEITFNLNHEGRLKIQAQETLEGRTVEVTIETNSVMSGEELEEAKRRSKDIAVH